MSEESIVYADGRDYCTRNLGLTSLQWINIRVFPGERNTEHIQAYYPEGDSRSSPMAPTKAGREERRATHPEIPRCRRGIGPSA